MKALTVYQPWASLECIGLMGTETRGRGTSYRGPLVIHAGLRWDAVLEHQYWESTGFLAARRIGRNLPALPLPLGCALAVGELVDCLEVTAQNEGMFSEIDRHLGDCSLGRYVWVLDDVRPLHTPIPWRGAQGLWTAPPELVAAIEAQTRRKAASGPVAQSARPEATAGASRSARGEGAKGVAP